MGNADVRLAIAAAASTVSGVTGYAKRPTSLNIGDAWPQWRGAERVDGMGFLETWQVFLLLPSDEFTADGYADTLGYPLAEALRPVLFVDSIVPAEVATSAGPLLALMITGRSE